MIRKFAGAVCLALICGVATAQEPVTTATVSSAKETSVSIYELPVEPMEVEGATTATSLAAFKGKVLLIVNVASQCGYTEQYEGLETLYGKYQGEGLEVLGFPSNDFRGQEPGTDEEILEFCEGRFGVSFPMFSKISVRGESKAPLYKYLTEGEHPGKGEVSWNFNKFLVDRKGNVVAHFDSKVKPEDPLLEMQVRMLLADK